MRTTVLLAVGLGLGFWMIVERELYGRGAGTYLVSAHTHAILVGFVIRQPRHRAPARG